MLRDWASSLDIVRCVDSDWDGCGKSTSGSTAQIELPCDSCGSTLAAVTLSFDEAELYAVGQGTREALFLKSLILEAEPNLRSV